MVKIKSFIYFCFLLFITDAFSTPLFKATISTIPLAIQKKMYQFSWHEGCPTSLADLRYVELTYWGFDNTSHTGVLIVNKDISNEVVSIFQNLFDVRFPIERMQIIDDFKGNDLASMAANNTSAFNCRQKLQSDVFSLHAYGRAIDINPLLNPYMNANIILPPNGKAYTNRWAHLPGMIHQSSAIYRIFKTQHWSWGGDWKNMKDYQHFEKR